MFRHRYLASTLNGVLNVIECDDSSGSIPDGQTSHLVEIAVVEDALPVHAYQAAAHNIL